MHNPKISEAKSSSPLEPVTSGTILDTRAKARLTGAMVIVAAIVVWVPEVLLRSPVRTGAQQAPERPPLPSNVTAAREEASAPPTAAGPPVQVPHLPAAARASQGPPAVGATPTPATVPPRREIAPAGAPQWTVQLGSFASLANAQHLADQLTGEGFPASVSGSSVAGRTLYRVRSVATGDRAAMEALAGELQAAGHSGTVLPR